MRRPSGRDFLRAEQAVGFLLALSEAAKGPDERRQGRGCREGPPGAEAGGRAARLPWQRGRLPPLPFPTAAEAAGPAPASPVSHGSRSSGAGSRLSRFPRQPSAAAHRAWAGCRRPCCSCPPWKVWPVRMEDEELEWDENSLQEEGEEEEALREQEEEAQVLAPAPLTEEVLREGLSLLCKTRTGLAHALVKFEATQKNLTDISLLECFVHLQYVDLSENKLQDLSPLCSLTSLLWLKVDGNLLTSPCLKELPYLQFISLAQNHIKDVEGITHPRLTNLILKGNRIQSAQGLSHGQLFNLQILELRGNTLESTAGLNLPKLKNLYLAQNVIQSLEGIEGLEQLATLHLRDNSLESLDGFCSSMKCLQYLNLRNNRISSLQEVAKLRVLPMLQALVLMDNPCCKEPSYRLEVLVMLPHLQRLDKELFEQEEQEEANRIRWERQEKEKEMEGK